MSDVATCFGAPGDTLASGARTTGGSFGHAVASLFPAQRHRAAECCGHAVRRPQGAATTLVLTFEVIGATGKFDADPRAEEDRVFDLVIGPIDMQPYVLPCVGHGLADLVRAGKAAPVRRSEEGAAQQQLRGGRSLNAGRGRAVPRDQALARVRGQLGRRSVAITDQRQVATRADARLVMPIIV